MKAHGASLKNRAGGFRLLLLIVAAAWLCCAVSGLGAAAAGSEEWYVVHIAGRRAGTMHERTEKVVRDGVTLFRTLSESKLTISRLGASMELGTSATALETEDGDLLEVVSELRLSAAPMKTEARVESGRVVLKSYTGSDSSAARERAVPFSGRLLGPEGIRRAAEAGLKKPGDTVVVQSFLAELAKPVTVTQVLETVEPLPGSSPPREALRVSETSSAFPGKRTAWLDRTGRTLLSSDDSPFGEMTSRLTTREEALSTAGPAGGGAAALPFERTLARSNVRLPRARSIEAVTLRLERRDGAAAGGWDGLEGPGQTVLEKSERRLVLRVERSSRGAAPRPAAAPGGEFLRANEYLDTKDELLVKAVEEALAGDGRGKAAGAGGALRRALRLENWVTGRMTFDAGIAFAPSGEVVRGGRGTCAQFAVLLAAMLRAAGIPSRVLIGYVYLNGIWGGHAWVEAWIDGAWVMLDAAVNGPGAADAARFAAARSSLDDGLGGLLAGGQGLLGNLRVTVLSYVLDGRKVDVDPGAPLYSIDGDLYVNPGLGLRVRKPSGFVFEDLSKTWPDETLLAMKGPAGESVRLLQGTWRPGRDQEEAAVRRLEELVPGGRRSRARAAGKTWPFVEAGGAAAAAVLNGPDVWIFSSKGRGAAERLKKILKSFSLGRLVPPPPGDF